MPAPADFYIKQGGLEPPLEFTCQDADKAAVAIQTAASIVLRMRAQDTKVVVIAGSNCVNLDDGSVDNRGKGRYVWATGNTDVAGDYEAEVWVTLPGSRPMKFPGDGYVLVRIGDDV